MHVISGAHYFDESSKSVKPRRVKYLTAGNYHVAAVLETSTNGNGDKAYGDDFMFGVQIVHTNLVLGSMQIVQNLSPQVPPCC